MKHIITLLFIASTDLLFSQSVGFKAAKEQFEKKNYQQVVTLLESQKSPDSQALALLGKSYFHLKQPQKAIPYFKKATQLKPKSAEAQYWLGMANFDILRSDIPFNKKGYYAHQVRKTFKTALKLDSTHVEARKELARYYLNAPRIAGGSTSKAKKHAKILKKYDKTAGYRLEAGIYVNTKAYDQAEKVYQTMIKEGLADETIYYWLSEVNHRSKDFKEAFDYCRQMAKKYPDYLIGYYQYAKVAVLAKQNIAEGIKKAQLYLKKDPDNQASPGNHWVYYRLGTLYQLKGDDTKAQEAFREALKIKPDFKQAKEALNN
ncbi:hypothetical protein BKI52_18195 [marine bacterium AO1-C]|nr:hypothetical protein BKI52_18195 [marine bacterium AO1-C]